MLAGAAVVLLVLGILGIGVEGKLQPESLRIPGTESAQGAELLRRHFGDSAPFAVLLRGPAAALDRQGPRLVAALQRDPRVTTLSAWDQGAGLGQLRPRAREALILVDFHQPLAVAMKRAVPRLERLLRQQVRPPVQVSSAGYASVARAIQEESIAIAKRGEAIAIPLLLIVLLIVFRSPLAAAIPLLFGATTVIASRGLMSIAAEFVGVSALGLTVASMIGLALGVDYALLIVSRFREELSAGADPASAAATTRRTAGRTTAFAGSTLLVAILVAVFLVPGEMLVSLCATVVGVILLAVAGPWFVGPAILVLAAPNLDRWQISRRGGPTRWLALSRAALRRPHLAALLSALLLLLVASPAVSLATGPVTIEQLPRDNQTRRAVETIEAAVGGGWIAPSVVVAASADGPITTPGRLAALSRWQAAVGRDPAVSTVVGPAALARRVEPLRRAGAELLADGGQTRFARMTRSLDRAGGALGRLRRGLGRASEGAQALAAGSGRAQFGAGRLQKGLALALAGGAGANAALQNFSHGAHLLAAGQRSARLGASVLGFSGDELDSEAGAAGRAAVRLARRLSGGDGDGTATAQRAASETLEKLEAAWRELSALTVGTGDPRYPALASDLREALTAASGTDPVGGGRYAPGYQGLPAALAGIGRRADEAQSLRRRLAGLRESVHLQRHLAARLEAGTGKLASGSRRLAWGSDRIKAAAAQLSGGLARLEDGARRLAAGLGALRGGNAALGQGLSAAFHRTRPLVRGAQRAETQVSDGRRRLRRASPGLFKSGYFTLSALDGAPAAQRRLARQALDLDHSGAATALLVVPRQGIEDPATASLDDRLRRRADSLAAATGTRVELTGGVVQATEYARVTTARLPALVIAITLVTLLVMIAVLRALPLALLAIALNLLTVAAAFGVLRLLLLAPEGLPFAGTGHIDPVGAAGIFGVVFGLSIDYAVFLLMRMREHWEREGDNDAAIAFGLERTASVITGAATVMAVVFCIFAAAPIASLAQFGVALTVAVLLDATVIRLALLPALMRLAGPRIWWLPAPLARLLPRLSVEG